MKNVFLILIVSFLSIKMNAQNTYSSSGRRIPPKPVKKTGFDRDKLVLGGDFRISLGAQIGVGIAPIVGYKITDNFFAGVRVGYSFDRAIIDYNNLPAGSTNNVFKFNSYSGSIWARYLLWESIFLQTELEYDIFDTYYQSDITGLYEPKSIESPSVLLGVGFRQPISDRVSFNTTILYDVLNAPYSYYQLSGKGGFDFRIGVLVGF